MTSPPNTRSSAPHAPSPAPGYETRAAIAAALIAMVLCGLLMIGSRDFPLDDAWIHLSYAKSLRLGDGLSYNPGDWETGFSSPLWVLALAVWPLGADPVIPVKLLGLLLHGVTAWIGASLVIDLASLRAKDDRPIPVFSLALLCGVLVASTPTALQGATSGMELPLSGVLVLATARATFRGSAPAAAALAALSVWSRPESLAFCGLLSGGLWFGHRIFRRPPVASLGSTFAPALGATVALIVWVIYCLAVSGYPWPNTAYVKTGEGGLASLAYLTQEVLPWHPWLVSLTGVMLLGLAARRELQDERFELSVLMLAFAGTLIAIALTRPLHPGVGFYERRYFGIVAALPSVVMPLGLVGLRRVWAVMLVLPLAVVTGLQCAQLAAQTRDLEHDTEVLHTTAARHVAANLPGDAVVAVEGAGAIRFFAPRTMTVVDLVGLNDGQAAHLHNNRVGKTCHFVRQGLTHAVMPVDWLGLFAPVFELRAMAQFVDDRYTQVDPPRPAAVVVAAVDGTNPPWPERCGSAESASRL